MRCWWSSPRPAAAALAAALSAFAPPPMAAAQSAAGRAALQVLQDSLDAISDPAALRRFSRDWAPSRDRTMRRLRRGFLALAAGRLSGKRRDLDAALIQFDWAGVEQPEWPYPWFGRGLAKLALSEGQFIPKEMAGQRLGVNFYQGSTADIVRAFERDSAFTAGVKYLAEILPAQGDRTQPAAYVRALAVAARDSAADTRVRLVLGRAYRTNGLYRQSLDELAAFARAGGDSGLAELERARSLAGAGRLEEAAAAWLAGAVHPADQTRRVFRRDLAWIATEDELREWDALPDSARRGWLEAFWALRDAESVRESGARLREHLRRWAYAHRHFRVIAPERKTDFRRVVAVDIGDCARAGAKSLDDLTFEDPARLDDLRRKERLLDHRGVIYIRHGEPARRVRTLPAQPGEFSPLPMPDAAGAFGDAPSIDPYSARGLADGQSEVSGLSSEIWQYWFGGESRLLYFGGGITLGTFAPTTLYSFIPLQPGILYAAATLDPRYRRVAFAQEQAVAGRRTSVPVRCMATTQRLEKDMQAALTTSVRTDSYTLLFESPLDPVIQISAVGRPDDGSGRMLVVFAVPAARLVAEARQDGGRGVAYRLELRVSAVDRARGIVRAIDTLRTFVAADTLEDAAHLTGLVELPVPAGLYDVRVAVFRPESRSGSTVMRAGVPLGTGPALSLSDIVLGLESGALEWENRGSPVRVNPLDAYPAGAAAPLYYEMHGLVPGRTYRTTVSLTRADEQAERGVRLLFTEAAEAASMQVRRTVGLENLRRGQYRLVVSVEDSVTGATVARERMMNVH